MGHREDRPLERQTIAEAAKKLEVTQEAIRARIRRGTIEHDKDESGKTYVYLTEDEAHNQQKDNTVVNGVVNDYITSLKSEIESLKADREVWQEEAKRKDTIIAQMTQTLQTTINRIPELEAPLEPAEGPVSHLTEESGGVVPPERENRSWWRRIFAP